VGKNFTRFPQRLAASTKSSFAPADGNGKVRETILMKRHAVFGVDETYIQRARRGDVSSLTTE